MGERTKSRDGSGVLLAVLIALFVVPALAAVLMIAGSLVAQQVHAPVNADSLARSVGVEAGSAFVKSGECKQSSSEKWSCDVSDQGGSGGYVYDVTSEEDSSCWDARLEIDGGETPGNKKMSGCVNYFEGGWWVFLLE